MKLSTTYFLFAGIASSICSIATGATHECELPPCVVNLGVETCTEALDKFDFNGDCCSLQEVDGGNCTVVVTTDCYYVEKGTDGCATDQDGNIVCVSVPGTGVRAGSASSSSFGFSQPCPSSVFVIPQPVVPEMEPTATLANATETPLVQQEIAIASSDMDNGANVGSSGVCRLTISSLLSLFSLLALLG